jgi:hypothetical protein
MTDSFVELALTRPTVFLEKAVCTDQRL